MPTGVKSKRIAIVGTGGAGLAALYALGHTNHEVTLFEAGDRLGGHLNAATFTNPKNGETCLIDTAFQIINDTTYRALTFNHFLSRCWAWLFHSKFHSSTEESRRPMSEITEQYVRLRLEIYRQTRMVIPISLHTNVKSLSPFLLAHALRRLSI